MNSPGRLRYRPKDNNIFGGSGGNGDNSNNNNNGNTY